MNPIAVSVTHGKPVFMGVAEAAAAGTAAPGSVVDLFCQMLAAAQAGVTAIAGPSGESIEGESLEVSPEEAVDPAAVAAAMTAIPTLAATGVTTAVEDVVVPIDPEAAVVEPVPVLDPATVQESVDVAEKIAAATTSDAPAPPPMSLAMQAALARAGLTADGAMTARRFGEPAIAFARPVQPAETVPEEGAMRLREAALPSAKSTDVNPEQADSGGDTGDSSHEVSKPTPTLHTPKSGDTSVFEVKTPIFAGAEVHAAARARTEPTLMAAQPDVPQSVSVRDVGDVVVRSVQYLSGRTEDVVTVRLAPQSLGELRIMVQSGERGMEVVLTAANQAAREALETNLVGLREALGSSGLNIERVSVQVFAPFDGGYQPASGQQQQAQGGAGQSARQPNTAYRESSGSPTPQHNSGEQQPRRQQHAGRLNMWV